MRAAMCFIASYTPENARTKCNSWTWLWVFYRHWWLAIGLPTNIHKLEKIYTQKKREQQQIWCLRQACHMTSGSGQSNCVYQSITWKWVLAALNFVTYLLLQIGQLERPTRADYTCRTNFEMRCTTLAFNSNLFGRGMASEIISSKWRRFSQHGPKKWETICTDLKWFLVSLLNCQQQKRNKSKYDKRKALKNQQCSAPAVSVFVPFFRHGRTNTNKLKKT